MALVVFLRGVNVSGHRRFRPSELQHRLARFGVVNIGAAGTLIAHSPGSRAKFLVALHAELPFTTVAMVCDGREVMQLASTLPFREVESNSELVHFVSLLAKPGVASLLLPVSLPEEQDWCVRVHRQQGRFLCGTYRKHMRTAGVLGQLDKRLGVAATTRTWNTMQRIVRILGRTTMV